jgi:hypothetical protein
MRLISLAAMMLVFATGAAQAATIVGSDAQLVYKYLGFEAGYQAGVAYLKATVTEKHEPLFIYETNFTVNDLPQNLTLSQEEQSDLFQILRSSGLPVHTTVGGTQFNWILASVTCTAENSCDLEDIVEARLFGAKNSASNSCFERVEECATGEKTVSCAVSAKLHGVKVCTCCPKGRS